MKNVGGLLDEAHRIAGLAGYTHVVACVQRKTTRRALTEVAKRYREAADLIDEAAALLPESNKGTPTSE